MSNCSLRCPLCKIYNPTFGGWILRLGVGMLFLFPGIAKIMDPAMFQDMLGALGWPVFLFWVVVAFELLGAIIVLLGKILPLPVYKIALLGQFIILLMASLFVVYPTGDPVPLLFHILAMTAIVALFVSRPKCPWRITGDTYNDHCPTK